MKKRMQQIIALVLTAGMAFSSMPVEAETSQGRADTVISEEKDESEINGATKADATAVSENGITSAEDVGRRIQKLLDEARSFGTCTDGELNRAQKEIEEIREAYGSLESKEQEILSDSIGYLEDAEAAIERMLDISDQYRRTGTVKLEQTDHPSSFRFINGKKINAALKEAIQETAAVAAEESGEPEQVVEALAEGTLEASDTEYADTTIVTDPGEQTGFMDAGDGPVTATAADSEELVGTAGTCMGIDISAWNGTPDFDELKAAGVKFVIIRLGYGNNEPSQDDKQFERSVKECERVGIPWGAYIYSYAMDLGELDSEVAHAQRLLAGKNPQLPVYIDLEDPSQERAHIDVDKFATRFCVKMAASGYKTGLYASLTWFEAYFTHYATMSGFSNWIAQWWNSCTYGGNYDMWQYSASGKVNGIKGNVDMDYYYGTIGEQAAASGKPMFRMYCSLNKEHFYTSSIAEWEALVGYGWKAEGIGWFAPKKSETPVYRLYNPSLKDHHYTKDQNELDTLTKQYGWIDEGIGWYSDDKETVPVYREFHPKLISGSHNYTTAKKEHDYLTTVGWVDERIAWYALKAG
uniref:glycoside hydrolase family 25 protein n=1 Tax=Eubacterium cellulosolvens TaxID=29322 RepID=UPI00068739A7|nr:glycoside hydrolase family 25 protein [[Eubacterium] cellulosolvens]